MNKKVLQKNINNIISINRNLSSVKKLTPSSFVDENFSNLVNIVESITGDDAKRILSESKIISIRENIRRLSSLGEFELECFWVEKILKSNHTYTALMQFPYFYNYERMTDLEARGIKVCELHENHGILFVGSGPLPLTSIMLSGKHGFNIDNIDLDKKACELSTRLIKNLNLSSKLNVINKNIFDVTSFSSYQTIFIAALTGETESEKLKIINHITKYAQKGTHIILRSVADLGTLLYTEVTNEHLKNINVVSRYDRPKGVINNLIVGCVK